MLVRIGDWAEYIANARSHFMNRSRILHTSSVALAYALIFLVVEPRAQEIQLGDVKLKVEGALTAGTTIRTSQRDPKLVPPGNGARIGVPGTMVSGRNQDDGNLNFNVGKPVSTVIKGVFSIDAKYGGIGMFVRGKAWYDHTLTQSEVPFGNLPSNFTGGQPLSDRGFANSARFRGVSLLDAYLYGSGRVQDIGVSARLGNQMVPWGSPEVIPGGLFTSINAIDYNAFFRPGALPEEVGVRMPAAYGKVEISPRFSIEGFFQFSGIRNQAVGCGTFLSTLDYVSPGCNLVIIGAVGSNDLTSLTAGDVVGRAPTPNNSNPQFGVGGSYLIGELGTRVGIHYARVNSRSLTIDAVSSTRVGPPFIPGNFDGQNGMYRTSYPANIDLFAGTISTQLKNTKIYGEITFKRAAPVQLNSSDLLNAFASLSAPTPLRQAATETPRGTIYPGFDRYNLGQFQLGVFHSIPNVLNARALTLAAEAGVKQVYGLPDPVVRRYGRTDLYGQGPVGGVCPVGTQPLGCTNRGYITSNAWGYRLKASLAYTNVLVENLQVTPSIALAHDVSGWSADNVFNQGRMVLNIGLRSEYKSRYFFEFSWNPIVMKGLYDNLSDRQSITFASGLRF